MSDLKCYHRSRWHRTNEDDKCSGLIVGFKILQQTDSMTGRVTHTRRMYLCAKHVIGKGEVVYL